MRILRQRRTANACARAMIAALALLSLLVWLSPIARADTDGMIRVKLARLGAPSEITMEADCDYYLAGQPSARIPAGTSMTVSASDGALTLSAGNRSLSLGASATLMRSAPGSSGMRFTAPALSNRFCGDVEFTASGGVITTVLHIYIEDYLYGVVGYEMAPSSGLEALKAQAIASRGSALRLKAARSGSGYDVADTDDALTFKGCSAAAEYADAIAAVDATRGSVLYYGDSPAQCYYSDSNGGQTESAGNALGTPLAYSAVTDDPYDLDSAAPKKAAFIRKDGQELNASLRGALLAGMTSQLEQLGLSTDAADIHVNAIERVTACDSRYAAPSRVYRSLTFQLNVTGRTANGSAQTVSISVSIPTFGGFESWYDLSINAQDNETVWVSETSTGFEVTFRRSGHGVGMSQRGAQVMARGGRGYTEILQFYYPGTELKQLSLTDTTRDAAPQASESPAAEPIGAARLNEKAALYEHADANSTVLTALPAGATVDVYAIQDGWAAVASSGRYGFVRTNALTAYAREEDGDDEISVPAEAMYAQLADNAGLYINTDDSVQARQVLARGSYVKVLAYNRKWAYVRTPESEQGYVKLDYLNAVQSLPSGDTPSDNASGIDGGEITVVKGKQYVYVQASALRLYRTYSTDSEVLATLSEGERVLLGAYNSKWACVQADGETGFVLISGLTKAASDAQTDAIDGGEIEKVSGTQYAVVIRGGAALYESWREGSKQLTTLSEGDRVLLGAYNGKWACVQVDSLTGYMRIEDLELTDEAPAGDDDGVFYLECEAVTTMPLRLYNDAALSGTVLAKLDAGTPVHVYAYNSQSAYVEADGVRGFLAVRGLQKVS